MIPIDGEKLIEWLENVNTQGRGSLEERIRNGEYNLPPGTLIIQREEGYEKRDCYECIAWNDDYYSCNLEMFKSKSERCSYKGYRTKINCGYENVKDTQECRTCRYVKPCKYHVTDSELRAAYIVGGGEK